MSQFMGITLVAYWTPIQLKLVVMSPIMLIGLTDHLTDIFDEYRETLHLQQMHLKIVF